MQRFLAVALTGAAFLWVGALFAAPYGLSAGSILAGIFYDACGLICHQRPERSFHLAGLPMPVCARCLGLYVSGAAGALLAWRARVGWPPAARVRTLLVWSALPTAVTLVVEATGLAQPGSVGRTIAAVPLGLALGFVLVATLREESGDAVRPAQMRYHA